MYQHFFGFTLPPFSKNLASRDLFVTERHKASLSRGGATSQSRSARAPGPVLISRGGARVQQVSGGRPAILLTSGGTTSAPKVLPAVTLGGCPTLLPAFNLQQLTQ